MAGILNIVAEFKSYPSWLESINDHSRIFNKYIRYKKIRGCTDYKLVCKYVKEAGYASDINYTKLLIDIIEQYDLFIYDNAVLNENIKHIVIKGDTLWKLSVKYLGNGLRFKEIMKINNLTSTNISIDMELIIPKK